MTQYGDDAKRVKDAMDMHAVAGAFGWAVFALADGKPLDNTAYETWHDAVRAAKWDRDNYLFIEIQPDGMTDREANAVLSYARELHKMGYRIPSPDWEAGPLASSMPHRANDRARMATQLATGRLITPADVPYGNLPAAFTRKKN